MPGHGRIRILYDITSLAASRSSGKGFTGIARYVENVAAGLARSDECEVAFTLGSAPRLYGEGVAYARERQRFGDIAVRVPPLERLGAFRWLNDIAGHGLGVSTRSSGLSRIGRLAAFRAVRLLELAAPVVSRQDAEWADIYHNPSGALPRLPGRSARPVRVITVHDVIPLIRPEFFDSKIPGRLRRAVQSIGRDDWVLADSASTRHDLLALQPHLDPLRVVVVLLAASDAFRPCHDPAALERARERCHIPSQVPYLLTLNTLEPRKNLEGVIRAFVRLTSQEQTGDLHLVLAGGKGWKDGPLMDLVNQLGPLRERVRMTGYVQEEDLAALYSGATAFVFPSHYEGFGLPPLEAMQCGTPVITADNSSLPEVTGDAALLVRAGDDEALADRMLQVVTNAELRRQMSARSLAQAAKFSWDRCVEETVAVYRKALAS